MNAKSMWRVAWLTIPLSLGTASAADFKVNYLPPATGALLTVSAPMHTSTPLVVTISIDGKPKTAAVLGNGLYRMKAIIADGTMHPDVAANPKAQPLPSQADLLVPFGQRISLIVRSHDEVVGGGGGGSYTLASCTTPFVLEPREGFAYKATYLKDANGCALSVTERAADPPDAPESPLASLDVAGGAR